VAGLEHKLGIHASPTCVLSFGENEGAIGYLLGGENKGIACMFTMMNAARLGVGLQGVAISERAYQQALAYAQERRQGKPWGRQHVQTESVPIIEHPDVRRTLLTMKATIEAMRALCYANAMAIDVARASGDPDEKARARAREELLTPLSKGFCSEACIEMTSLGLQVHGGMGYVEETGAAQHYRDARITTIYEGTTAIQAMDLVTRKLTLAGGSAAKNFIDEMRRTTDALSAEDNADLGHCQEHDRRDLRVDGSQRLDDRAAGRAAAGRSGRVNAVPETLWHDGGRALSGAWEPGGGAPA